MFRSISLDMSQKSSTMDDGSRRSTSDVKPTTPLRQRSFIDDNDDDLSDDHDMNHQEETGETIQAHRTRIHSYSPEVAGVSVTLQGTLRFVAKGPPRGPPMPKL